MVYKVRKAYPLVVNVRRAGNVPTAGDGYALITT